MIQQRPNPLPAGYLRGFAIPSENTHIWRYEKHATGLSLSKNPDRVAKICCADALAMMVGEESQASPADSCIVGSIGMTTIVLDTIEAAEVLRSVRLDHDELLILARYAAQFLTHNAAVHQAGSGRITPSVHDRIVALTRAYQSDRPQDTEELLESIEEMVVAGQSSSGQSPIDAAERLSVDLLDRVWVFLRPAAGMAFVTSDRPLCCRQRAAQNDLVDPFQNPEGEITLPLRRRLAVVFRSPAKTSKRLHGRIVELGESDTRRLNRRTTLAAERYAYGPTPVDGMNWLLKTPAPNMPCTNSNEPQIVIEGVMSTYGLSA